MTDKLDITIRIADLPPFGLTIERNEEETIRTAVHQVNRLWRKWRQDYSKRSSNEVLGMVAFQFAKAFVVHNREMDDTEAMLGRFEQELDRVLLDVGGSPLEQPDRDDNEARNDGGNHSSGKTGNG